MCQRLMKVIHMRYKDSRYIFSFGTSRRADGWAGENVARMVEADRATSPLVLARTYSARHREARPYLLTSTGPCFGTSHATDISVFSAE